MAEVDARLRQVVRKQLAEALGEPLERLSNDTRLRKLGRYTDAAARQIFAARGLQLPARGLQDIERVGHLLDALINARPGRITPESSLLAAAEEGTPGTPL